MGASASILSSASGSSPCACIGRKKSLSFASSSRGFTAAPPWSVARPLVLLGRDPVRRSEGGDVTGPGVAVARRDRGCEGVHVVVSCPQALPDLKRRPRSLYVHRPEDVVELGQ